MSVRSKLLKALEAADKSLEALRDAVDDARYGLDDDGAELDVEEAVNVIADSAHSDQGLPRSAWRLFSDLHVDAGSIIHARFIAAVDELIEAEDEVGESEDALVTAAAEKTAAWIRSSAFLWDMPFHLEQDDLTEWAKFSMETVDMATRSPSYAYDVAASQQAMQAAQGRLTAALGAAMHNRATAAPAAAAAPASSGAAGLVDGAPKP